MSALDSRSLTYLDCFGQRLQETGRLRYAITSPTAASLWLDDKPFVVEVSDRRTGEPQQHDVEVRHSGGEFTAAPTELRISAGDVIVWHSVQESTPPYAVWGETAAARFSSMSLS